MTTTILQLRTLLVLGRISNLPTVCSNCLAAWLLNGGQAWNNFYVLCLGATLLYIGGMFLNDAFDAEFDRQFRKERPIPSGQITARTVWIIGTTLLLLGWLLMLFLGISVALLALLLVGSIVFYDAVHKRTAFAPVIMAACRFLLYLVAASATLRAVGDAVVWHGLALATYITGLSYLARSESTSNVATSSTERERPPLAARERTSGIRDNGDSLNCECAAGEGSPALRGQCADGYFVRRWPLLFLIAPLVAVVLINSHRDTLSWIVSAILLAWMLWCLRGMVGTAWNGRAHHSVRASLGQPDDGAHGVTRPTHNIGKSVAGLLAGIVLVDWAAAPQMAVEFNMVFAGLFILALILQRKIPAT